MQKIALGFGFAVAALAEPITHVEMFEDFMKTHDRKYESAEKQRRLEIFQENMKMIEASNAKNLGYRLGVTPFTDLTFEEFRAQFVGGMTKLTAEEMENITKFERPLSFSAPESVDWVAKGAVSSVKSQGNCGSCWTFSATGALEGAMKIAGRDLVELSQQELVDCDTGKMGGHGCNGGNPAQAFGWVKSHGMCSSKDYPYLCVDKTQDICREATCTKCSMPTLKAGGETTKGDVIEYGMVGQNPEDLEAAVARQPISVAIEADTAVFQHYKSGVLTNKECGQNIDHAVLAVGYGVSEEGQEYWKVKNSWSPAWGEDGYVRLAKGSTAGLPKGMGECGIRTMATYPTVKPVSGEVVV